MVRLPRDAPTPAAVITYVLLGTFSISCALGLWFDAQEQAAAGEWAWPVDPMSIVRSSVWWALNVSLWCAVLWVASVRDTRAGHPWRAAAVAAAVVVAWTILAWRSYFDAFAANGWYVPWPGPVAGVGYTGPQDPLGNPPVVFRPGLGTPIAVVATLVVVALLARRHAIRNPVGPEVAPSRTARLTALAVLVPPAVAALVAATLLQLSADDYRTPLQRYLEILENPGFGLALAVAAALLIGGTGRGSWVLLGLVWLSVVGPVVLGWWHGGDDDLLATMALGTIAIALAAAVRPAATALARLDERGPGGGSVPERSDADDRAWA